MVDDITYYEKRIIKLNHRLRNINKGLNEFKMLSKEIARLNKILVVKINKKQVI